MAAEIKVISQQMKGTRALGCVVHTLTSLKDTDHSALCDTNVYSHHLMSTARRKDKDPKKSELEQMPRHLEEILMRT